MKTLEQRKHIESQMRIIGARKLAAKTWKKSCCVLPEILLGDLVHPPTLLNHKKLVQVVTLGSKPAWLSSHQREHLVLMKDLVQWIKEQETELPLSTANTFIHHFDQVFTQSRLMERVQVIMTAPGKLWNEGMRGRTLHYSKQTARGETIRCALIEIDPFRMEGEPVDRWHTRVLSTLLHELWHAYVGIFMDPFDCNLLTYLSTVGLSGHGSVFGELYMHMAKVLSEEDILHINLYDACGRHVENDATVLGRIEMIADVLELDSAWNATDLVKAGKLEAGEDMDPEEVYKFRGYLNSGTSALETAMRMSFCARKVSEWRQSRQGSVAVAKKTKKRKRGKRPKGNVP